MSRESNNLRVPKILEKLFAEVEQRGMDVEGIFRHSGSAIWIDPYKQQIDEGISVDFSRCSDIHIISSLIKLFFRQLPTPLFPSSFYDKLVKIDNPNENEVINSIMDICSQLPDENFVVLKYLMEFLHKLSLRHEETKMNSRNLAVVWAPNLLYSSNSTSAETLSNSNKVSFIVQYIIDNASKLYHNKATTTTTSSNSNEDKPKQVRSTTFITATPSMNKITNIPVRESQSVSQNIQVESADMENDDLTIDLLLAQLQASETPKKPLSLSAEVNTNDNNSKDSLPAPLATSTSTPGPDTSESSTTSTTQNTSLDSLDPNWKFVRNAPLNRSRSTTNLSGARASVKAATLRPTSRRNENEMADSSPPVPLSSEAPEISRIPPKPQQPKPTVKPKIYSAISSIEQQLQIETRKRKEVEEQLKQEKELRLNAQKQLEDALEIIELLKLQLDRKTINYSIPESISFSPIVQEDIVKEEPTVNITEVISEEETRQQIPEENVQ